MANIIENIEALKLCLETMATDNARMTKWNDGVERPHVAHVAIHNKNDIMGYCVGKLARVSVRPTYSIREKDALEMCKDIRKAICAKWDAGEMANVTMSRKISSSTYRNMGRDNVSAYSFDVMLKS